MSINVGPYRINGFAVFLALVSVSSLARLPHHFAPGAVAIALATLVTALVPADRRSIVVATMAGLATGVGSIMLFATGVFATPLITTFGWTSTEYFAALQFALPITILTPPIVGLMVDRFGPRRVILPSTLLLGLGCLAFASLTQGLASFYLLFAAVPLLGAGTTSIAYARVITGWFRDNRGLALGAGLSGMGLGGAVLTPMLQMIVTSSGWRMGWCAVGVLLICVTTPAVWLVLRDPPSPEPVLTALPKTAVPPNSPVFWWMLVTFFILAVSIGGMMYPLHPILVSKQFSQEAASGLIGVLSVSLIAGRALSGLLMDHYFAPRVAIAFLFGPVCGAIFLALDMPIGVTVLGVILIGLAAGAEVDVMAYLVSRYFEPRRFGSVYGWMFMAWTTGASVGPLLAAQSVDRGVGYAPALYMYAAILLIGMIGLERIGPYPLLNALGPNKIGDLGDRHSPHS